MYRKRIIWTDTKIFLSLKASVAQLAEQLTLNQRVVGSNPSGRTGFEDYLVIWET